MKKEPITEDVLERLGFDKVSGVIEWDNPKRSHRWVKMSILVKDFTIEYDYSSPSTHPDYSQEEHKSLKLVGNGGYDWEGEMELDIKYVHQLKILYHALTGKHLKYKQ